MTETPGTGSLPPESPITAAGTPVVIPPTAPPGARFDPVTGAELRVGASSDRRESFALQPGEPVMSFNLVTSMMPMASGTAPQTYKWALALGVVIPVVAGALGYLAFAFVAAAVVVPAVYIVYLYDVNQWEDEPLPVVLGAVLLAAGLAVGFTFLWHAGLLHGNVTNVDVGRGTSSVQWTHLLVLVLLVPILSEALKQIGPLVLSMRPLFDDMIDAMTFGIAAGASYAAAETIVVNRSLFSSFGSIDHPNAGFWVSLILSAAIVKPIVYGAATGIALAAFSGLGEGYDGFKPGYLRGLGEALLANVLFQGGLFVTGRLSGTTGAVLGLIWGGLIAGALVVRLRYLLHYAVLESALESASAGRTSKDTVQGTAWCPSCEMPLLAGANFCVVCGTATKAGSKVTRARNRAIDDPAAAPPPSIRAAAAGVAPRDNKKTALVVGSVAATIVLAGAVGQAAAAAGDNGTTPPSTSPIQVTPQVGSGPTTGSAPSPAPAPGPSPDATTSGNGRAAFGAARAHTLRGMSPLLGEDPSASPSGGIPITQPSQSDGTLPSSDPSESSSTGGTGGSTGGTGGTSSGNVIDLGGGVGYQYPDGWQVVDTEPGFGEVATDDGLFFAYINAAPTDMNTMIQANLQGVSQSLQNLQVSDPQQISTPTSSVVQAVAVSFQGVVASQQGGTMTLEGLSFYFLRQDGSGVTATALFPQGELDKSSTLADDLSGMLNSLVSTL